MSSIQKAITLATSIFRSLKTKEDQDTFMDAITEYYLQLEETPRMVITELKSTKSAKAEDVKTDAVKTEAVKTEAVKTEAVKAEAVKAKPVKTEAVKAESYKTAVLTAKTAEPFLWSDAEESVPVVIMDRILAARALFEAQTAVPPLKNLSKGKVYRTCILHSISDLHAKIFPRDRDDGFSEFLSEMSNEEFHALFDKDSSSPAFQDELERLIPMFFTKNVEAKSVKSMNFFTNHAGVSILRGDYDSSKMVVPSLREIFKIPEGSEPPSSLVREIAFAQAVQMAIVEKVITLLESCKKEYEFSIVKHIGAPYTPFSLSFKEKGSAFTFAGVISRERGEYVR